MAESILRLKVSSEEYDNKLKQATNGLTRYVDQCRKVGGTLEVVEKDTLDYVRALGQMDTTSRTATGKLAEMKKAFVELSAQYKQMTDAEKQSPFGKTLAASLDQLKGRIQDSKMQLDSINKEMSGSKFGQFGGIIDSLGQKMGLNANITELLTSKTALLSAGIGAAGAIVGKATQEWAKYNAELAKQDQITTVTTGLKGSDSDRMTDQARALTDTYGVDFREAINAANTLMTQFGQTGEQAMSLIRDGMQGMIQGDGPKLLSMIQQYAPAFRDAGVSASQLVAVIQNSEGGIFTDQNMNAIVMGIKNIRLMTKATSDALAQLGIDGQKMSQQLRDGSMTIFDALKQVATQIQGVNSNSQVAGEVMQQVFGRQGAMAGTKLGEAIATLNTNLEETKRQTGEVGDAYNDLYNANVKLNGAIRDCFEYDGWDQMATGIKANLVSALASVLGLLGRIKGALGGLSVGQHQGDTRNGGGQFIDRAVDRLRGGNTPGKQNIYTRQIQAYSGKILDINDQIRQIQEKAAQDMDGNMAVVYEKQIRNLENRKQAIQQNMAEYDKRAQAALNGTDTKQTPGANTITNTINTPRAINNNKNLPEYADFNKQLFKSMSGGGKGGGSIKSVPTLEEFWLQMSKNDMKLQDQKAAGDLVKDMPSPYQMMFDEIKKQYLDKQDFDLGKDISKEWKVDSKGNLTNKPETRAQESMARDLNKFTGYAEKTLGGVSSIVGGLSQLGVEIPKGLQDVLGGIQGITSIVTGIASLVAMIEALSTVQTTESTIKSIPVIGWALAGGGIVHAASGYEVPGNYYSGDQVPALLNSGELVLNKAQQGNLANELQGNGMQNMRLRTEVSGRNLIVVIENDLKARGKGQLATFKG